MFPPKCDLVGKVDNVSVPCLNPLVLRKELENILAEKGDLSAEIYIC